VLSLVLVHLIVASWTPANIVENLKCLTGYLMRCPSITYVPRVSGRCCESDAIPQGEDDESLDPKVPPLLDFRLQSNTCTLSEINSSPSSSTEPSDTCSPDGSPEPYVPEVRPFIPDGYAFTNRVHR
jgi:hypothetical protein